MGDFGEAPEPPARTATASSSIATTSTRLLEALDVTRPVTLVVHDWGSALGFDWANRHRDAVSGHRLHGGDRAAAHLGGVAGADPQLFQGFRSPAGEEMVLEKNVFVERVLPGSVLRELERGGDGGLPPAVRRARRGPPPDADLAARDPDRAASPRTWSRSSQPTPTGWRRAEVPKLFINAEPGAILLGAQREFCRSWPNQTEVTVTGIHFIQEDSPDEIGRAIAAWYRGLA